MDLTGFKTQLQQTKEHLAEDLKTIRTGRSNPAMVEDLVVEAYGGSTKLKMKELATITTEGASALVVVPFDPSTVPDIEKAILTSPLGLSPQTQGTRILIRIPAMSQEQREKYLKLVGQILEEKRSIVRNHRDEVRKKCKELFEKKELTEDERFRIEKEVDTLTQKVNEELMSIREKKEAEIQEI